MTKDTSKVRVWRDPSLQYTVQLIPHISAPTQCFLLPRSSGLLRALAFPHECLLRDCSGAKQGDQGLTGQAVEVKTKRANHVIVIPPCLRL
jgi:hypothetical protein